MSIIKVEDIRIYAFHGCMAEEGVLGGNYRVDVWVESDTSQAESSDNLEQTIDYVVIHDIVKEEMSVRSKLLEHVANRIVKKTLVKYPEILNGAVTIAKLNPPINGVVGEVSVTVTMNSEI